MLPKNDLPDLIFQVIRETAEAKGLSLPTLTLDSPVDGRLGLDSLDWAAVVVRLEMDTGIDPFASGAISELKTVSDLINLYVTAVP
jgi:acyl carrier protein